MTRSEFEKAWIRESANQPGIMLDVVELETSDLTGRTVLRARRFT